MSHRLTRRTWAALGILLVAIPALMVVFVCVWDERKYYLTSLLLVGLMFVPFVLRFEGRRPQARELVLLATMVYQKAGQEKNLEKNKEGHPE